MKAIIVDDERLARTELRKELDQLGLVEVVEEFDNAISAKKYIESHKIDLIFLDINMPEYSGFDLLADVDDLPKIIIISAYDHYAIKAFEYEVDHYLLKPIDRSLLKTAVTKVIESSDQAAKTELNEIKAETDKVFIKDGDNCWLVTVGDIYLLESVGNYVKVYFEDHHPMIHKSLNQLEERLDSKVFFRANRKEIINLNEVKDVKVWFNGGLKVLLKKGNEIELSRRQAVRFKEVMGF